MNKNVTIYQGFNSALSLKPLLVVLKRLIAEGGPGARKLYQHLLAEIEAVPGLLHTLTDDQQIAAHKDLIEALLAVVFPPSASHQEMHAIYFPFSSDAIFATELYREVILNIKAAVTYRQMTDFRQALLTLANNLILKQFYSHDVTVTAQSVQSHTDKETGLKQYFEMKLDAQFIEVKLINKEYVLPARFNPQRPLSSEELKEIFPLENFSFEGFMVANVRDITREQVITEMKNTLLDINTFLSNGQDCDLDLHIQSLIGLKEIELGITPFFKMNGFHLYADKLYKNSLLFKSEKALLHKDEIARLCEETFKTIGQPLIHSALGEESCRHNELLSYYLDGGAKGLILCPLKSDDGSLIGLIEVSSKESNVLSYAHLTHLQAAIPLFCMGLEKAGESLEMQVDKTIKEHFTAIQPAVEWKFTEAAFNYLQHKQDNDMAKMPAISFENIYPLYAAIDVRNSSVERNNGIQLDLIEQLTAVQDVIEAATGVINFPLLKEIKYKVEGFIASVSDSLLSDDELQIYDFLQNDIDTLFRNLRLSNPEIKGTIDTYFTRLDPQRKIIYHHRKDYEESITRINDILDRFVDSEQQDAQDVYPHYFERYITDGVELNMYIGQALSPHRRFSELYVRNLKLWQLHLLAKAARLTHALEKRLSLPLQTTQLILAHSLPLSISFRRKERKFDVDGAYNIRYEIIKKRIDKVHLKNSHERLTQPGKIAIVYSQQKELTEYLEFISFLQAQRILGENVEHLDLEDTQGISGLKALRVDVILGNDPPATSKQELSKMTTSELLKK